MQRYRVIIMLVLFGVLPVVAAFYFALTFPRSGGAGAGGDACRRRGAATATAADPRGARDRAGAADRYADRAGRSHRAHARSDGGPRRPCRRGQGDTTLASLRGYAVREPLAPGVPLTWPVVVAPGQSGFLAAVLEAGTRAVTIRVGSSTSQAALIDPGDRVDVILTAELQVDEGEPGHARAHDRRRRAAGRGRPPDRRPAGSRSRPGRTRTVNCPSGPRIVTATLEVTPAQGDRLVLGEQRGSLSLAVRSLAGAGARTPDAVGEQPPGRGGGGADLGPGGGPGGPAAVGVRGGACEQAGRAPDGGDRRVRGSAVGRDRGEHEAAQGAGHPRQPAAGLRRPPRAARRSSSTSRRTRPSTSRRTPERRPRPTGRRSRNRRRTDERSGVERRPQGGRRT